MDKLRITSLGIMVIVAVALVGVFTSNKPEDKRLNELKRGFMDGCIAENMPKQYCDCVFDGMFEKIGWEGIERIGKDEIDGKGMSFDDMGIMMEVAGKCFNKLTN